MIGLKGESQKFEVERVYTIRIGFHLDTLTIHISVYSERASLTWYAQNIAIRYEGHVYIPIRARYKEIKKPSRKNQRNERYFYRFKSALIKPIRFDCSAKSDLYSTQIWREI